MSSDRNATAASGKPLSVILMLFALAFLALDSCSSGVPDRQEESPQPSLTRPKALPDRVPGEYIVTVLPGTNDAMLRTQFGEYGVRKILDLGGNMFLMKLNTDPGFDAIKQKASEAGSVIAVQPNFIYRGTR